ncbi:MAG: hypothetical protein EA350_01600 [Gemmatimonadales bacterium]|nr:MAG: hypothetical protein EA350_01600 [Gemmatimonadales bacterium]
MSRKMTQFATLAALLLLVPAALHAQGQRGGMGGGPGGAQMIEMLLTSPAGFALEKRADLDITAEQAPRLQTLHDAFEETNKAHLELLRTRVQAMGQGAQGMQGQRGQGMGGQGMQGQRAQGGQAGGMAPLQDAMQALRTAREAQIESLGDVLTANQLRELRQLMAPRAPGGRGSR